MVIYWVTTKTLFLLFRATRNIITNIFGESDDEEFEGFDKNEVDKTVMGAAAVETSSVAATSARAARDEGVGSSLSSGDDSGSHDEICRNKLLAVQKAGPNQQSVHSADREDDSPSLSSSDEGVIEDDSRNIGRKQSLVSLTKYSGGDVHRRGSDDNKEQQLRPNSTFALLEDALNRQKEQRRINCIKSRTDITFINDLDDRVSGMIARMKLAAAEDQELSIMCQPATRKLKMLREVDNMIKKNDIKGPLIESGMLTVLTKWLSPLPNRNLPNQDIRTCLLRALEDFPNISTDIMKESGIGKAVMYLSKYPKELPQNKLICRRLISRSFCFHSELKNSVLFIVFFIRR